MTKLGIAYVSARLLFVLVAWASLTLGLDGADAPAVADDASSSEFTITLRAPRSVPVTAVTLAAEESLVVERASTIERAGSGMGVVTNLGKLGIDVQSDAMLGDVWSTSVVRLRSRAHVFGTVHAPEVIAGNAVLLDGGIDSTTALTPPTMISWTVRFERADRDVHVEEAGLATADPGRYGTVRVLAGATLSLKTGAYFIDHLRLEAGSRLVLNQDAGPILLYVRSTIRLSGEIRSTRGTPPDALVAYRGRGAVNLDAPFDGMIVAPFALLQLSSVPGGHAGAFFARKIRVASGTTVTFRAPHAILSAASTPPEPAPPAAGGWNCFLSDAASLHITPADQGSPESSTTLAGNLSFEFEDGRLTLENWQGTSGPATLGPVASRLETHNDPTLQAPGSLSPTGALTFMAALTFVPRDAAVGRFSASLEFFGSLRAGVLKGSALGQVPLTSTVLPGATLRVALSCEEVQPDAPAVALALTVTETGAVVLRGVEVRSAPASNVRPMGDDFLVRSFNDRGERIEEFGIRDPRLRFDAAAGFELTFPFSSGIRRVVLSSATQVSLGVDFTEILVDFCVLVVSAECARLRSPGIIQLTDYKALRRDTAISRKIGFDRVIDESANPVRQIDATAAADGAGNIVVSWVEESPMPFAAFVKGLAADGSVVFGKQRVDLAPQDVGTGLTCPAVARARGGDFAVAWLFHETPMPVVHRDTIKARLFAPNGSPRTDEIVVSDPTALDGILRSCPAMGMDAQGRVLVAWDEFRDPQRTGRVVARRLRSDGAFDGPEFEVFANNQRDLFPRDTAAAVEPGGSFVVSWVEPRSDPRFGNSMFQVVLAQRYNAAKSRLGAPIFVAEIRGAQSLGGRVTMSGGPAGPGHFLVTWLEGQTTVRMRSIDFQTGQPQGEAFVVNARPAAGLSFGAAAVGQGASGRWLTAWHETAGNAITAQVFDVDGSPLDIDFSVAGFPPEQVLIGAPAVVASGDRFFVIWAQRRGLNGSGQLIGRFYDGHPYPCPGDCGVAKALLRTGPPEDKASIAVFRKDGLGSPPLVRTGPEFGRFVVGQIVNGWFNIDLIGANRQKFNFYYVPLALPGGLRDDEVPPYDVSVQVGNFLDGECREGRRGEVLVPVHANFWAHELGHCVFGLADERACDPNDKRRWVAPRHPNIFATEARCRALSESPSACREIPNTRGGTCSQDPEGDGWWVSDPPDLMDSGRDFGPDCRKSIRLFFQGLR